MHTLDELKPFAQGWEGEVEENMVRVYDRFGLPRIEIFRLDVRENVDALAKEIVEKLNG